MKIAITYPPLPSPKGVPLLSQNRQFQWFHTPTYIYPVVPACAATLAKHAGHDVRWLDGIAEGWTETEFDRQLQAAAPELIMIETKTPVIKRHWQVVKRLKALCPTMTIVLVGDHVTALPEESMQNCPVDFILTGGDYDFLLLNLVSHLNSGVPLEPGIWRRDGAKLVSTGPFETQHDLKSLPFIDRELTRWHLYSVKNGNFRSTPGTYIMSGRDCWHGKCTFCAWTTLYPNYRARDPIHVVNEIGQLIERFGVREIMDDTGSFPVGTWLHTFCNEMIARGYNTRVAIDCNMRFGLLTQDQYNLMKKAGFRLVLFGLESANQVTLDRLVKGLQVEQILEGAQAAARAGLDVHVTVMLGYPWEGSAEIANTVSLARKLLIQSIASTLQVTQIIPYPGTPLFNEMDEQKLLLTHDWDEYDMRGAVLKCGVPDIEIKNAIRHIYKAFMDPTAIFNRLRHTRHLADDLKFYFRGFRSLLGHLRDFT